MTLRVTARQLQACGIFIKLGMHKKGAAAVVGNTVQEAGVNLDSTMYRAHPDASGGVREDLKSGGIAEWLGDRKLACIAFSRAKEDRFGVPRQTYEDDLETQCEFVVHELKHGENGNTPGQYAELWRQLTTETSIKTIEGIEVPRSIATLTANFMTMYERPKLGVGTDKLGEVRIPYAEAVAERYALIEAAGKQAGKPEPQGEPSTHLPKTPGPEIPAPYTPIPTVPADRPTRPPISASTAAWGAAMREEVGREIETRLFEIENLKNILTDLDKLSAPKPILALPPPAGLPGLNPVITPPQRTQTMFGRSWITSIFGVGTIGAAVASLAVDLASGNPINMSTILLTIATVANGTGLTQAKDKHVTGGTISAATGNTVPIEATVPDTSSKQQNFRPI